MRIGVPREIKVHEYRVGLVPAGVRELTAAGHEVLIESGAGRGIGVDDAHYDACGAKVLRTAAQVFESADMIVKVKEPQPQEIGQFKPGLIVFTYFHFAASAELTQA
jgi:alanine dehydrogenase